MKLLRTICLIVGVSGLFGVRILEDHLFYDPFLDYFKNENFGVFPQYDMGKLLLSYIFRYSLNVLFSFIIIQSLFKNKIWSQQAVVLMVLVFVLIFPIYIYCVYSNFAIGDLFSFYMRRFIIQPITLLLLVPIFYYRKYQDKMD